MPLNKLALLVGFIGLLVFIGTYVALSTTMPIEETTPVSCDECPFDASKCPACVSDQVDCPDCDSCCTCDDCDLSECEVCQDCSVDAGIDILARFNGKPIPHTACPGGRNELGNHWQISKLGALGACAANDACISMEYSEGAGTANLSSTCNTVNSVTDIAWDLYIKND